MAQPVTDNAKDKILHHRPDYHRNPNLVDPRQRVGIGQYVERRVEANSSGGGTHSLGPEWGTASRYTKGWQR